MSHKSKQRLGPGPGERKVIQKKDVVNGGLLVVTSEEDDFRSVDREGTWESLNGSRPSSSSGRKSSSGYRAPPINRPDSSNSTPRRTPTPSKQVHLQAARKKESNDGISYGDLDWEEHEQLASEKLSQNISKNHKYSSATKDNTKSSSSSNRKNNSHHNSEHSKSNTRVVKKHNCDSSDEDSPSSFSRDRSADNSAEQMLKMCYKKDNVSDLMEKMGFSESSSTDQAANQNHDYNGATGSGVNPDKHQEESPVSSQQKGSGDIQNSDEFDTDLEDEGDKSGEDAEAPSSPKAPNELMMEFIGSVMGKDWPNAQKLCKMILLYEPNNPEAMKFQGLIEEKAQLEEELANESGSDYDSEDDEDDDDDDEDEEDSDESGSDDDSDEESESDEEEGQTKQQQQQQEGSATHSHCGLSSTITPPQDNRKY